MSQVAASKPILETNGRSHHDNAVQRVAIVSLARISEICKVASHELISTHIIFRIFDSYIDITMVL